MATGGRAWLTAIGIGMGAACAQAQSPAAGADAVRLPPPAAGVWRYRYELTLWTTPPVGIAATDAAAPLARTTIVADEVLGGDRMLRRRVRGAAVEVPLLARFGAEGRAYARRLERALGEGRAAVVLDARNRARPAGAARVASSASALAGAGDALLDAVGPLGLLPPLPARTLRTGDAWTDTVALRVPGSALDEPMAVPATLRLVAVRAEGVATAAVVTVAARVRHAVLSDGSTADITLTGETVVDLAAGVPVRASAELRAAVRDPRGAVTPLRACLAAERLPVLGQGPDVAAGW